MEAFRQASQASTKTCCHVSTGHSTTILVPQSLAQSLQLTSMSMQRHSCAAAHELPGHMLLPVLVCAVAANCVIMAC